MIKSFIKIGIAFLILLVLTIVFILIFSQYTFNEWRGYNTIDYSVEIDAPAAIVFNYLGNSDNAKDWSSYIDHITTLNSDEYKDGEKGSIRRCFKNANETGIYWDEEVLSALPNEKRVLSIYNMHGFSFPISGLETEQIYEQISPYHARLSFTLFFANDEASWLERFKLHAASYTIYARFRDNLEKVKELVNEEYVPGGCAICQ